MPKAAYAELHCHSAYSFLDGASMPEELVEEAHRKGLESLFLTDHQGFGALMQLKEASEKYSFPVGVGTEVHISESPYADEHLVILAKSPRGYSLLSKALGEGFLASHKQDTYAYDLPTLASYSKGEWLILTGCSHGRIGQSLREKRGVWGLEQPRRELTYLAELFGWENMLVELTDYGEVGGRDRCQALINLAHSEKIPAVVTGNVHYARYRDKPLGDILQSNRMRLPLEQAAPYLRAQGAYLRSAEEMLAHFPYYQQGVSYAAEIGRAYSFDLSLVQGHLPDFPVPDGEDENSYLRRLVMERAPRYYSTPEENPQAWRQLEQELEVITSLGFAGYFLIIEAIVSFCSAQGIWCQGRGSAANSAVCYTLGITAVDAVRHKMLFERFLSSERIGPPDIDIDIEAKRREEVIQHVYERYGRLYAAQVANIITYRPRSAIRDAAFAYGYSPQEVESWVLKQKRGDDGAASLPSQVRHSSEEMLKVPRHWGIHSGGMILCDRPIVEICPVQWAHMPGRSVIQWDKDDCAAAGLVKFDLLGLGILTALRLSFQALEREGVRDKAGNSYNLYSIPQEDPEVYDLLCAAETVGVFQVESRAQIATLPRLKPRCFYDIVIDVALIRPGPIQGHSVSPYLKRRNGQEEVTYLHPLLRPALEKTLGVPLFQEQLMRIAMDAAGFSPAQADRLRKAMGSKRSREQMRSLKEELYAGMKAKGIDEKSAKKIYEKLEGFAQFGFPESHAFSFAYLVYASAWLKVHHPEAFYMGLLNSQPMGFYSPRSLVSDAQRHGVQILPVDVTRSYAHARIEPHYTTRTSLGLIHASSTRGIRLGLESIRGLSRTAIAGIMRARSHRDEILALNDKAERLARFAALAGLTRHNLELLAQAGALASLGIARREGVWLAAATQNAQVHKGRDIQDPLWDGAGPTPLPTLPAMNTEEEIRADLEITTATSAPHPMAYYRQRLSFEGILSARAAKNLAHGTKVRAAGIITHRQRPATAGGLTFLSLEDESGILNVLCSPGMWKRYQHTLATAYAIILTGRIEREGNAYNLVAEKCEEFLLPAPIASRDFR